MGHFKLFTTLLQYPDTLIILAFVFLVLIIILVKIDKLEKELEKIKTKLEEISKIINDFESNREQMLDEELDIIDKFLTEKGLDKNENKPKNKNTGTMKEAMKAPRISKLMNPKEDKEEED